MNSWAKPGVKCVCVNPSGWFGGFIRGGRLPPAGTVVTIAGFAPSRKGGVCLQIVGHPNMLFGKDMGWRIERFRPLITKNQEQDLELFQHHLEGRSVSEPA